MRVFYQEVDMVRKINNEDVADFISEAEDFVTSAEFDCFVQWMNKVVEKNELSLLSTNPPNHIYDLEDGTMDIQLGPENVDRKRAQQQAQAKTPFLFAIIKEGTVTEVLAFVASMQGDAQLEAVMAFYVRATGQYVSSTEQWRRLCERFGWGLSSDINNPFYRRIGEGILQKFRERGWI